VNAPPVNIRDATERDLPAIVAIYNAAIPGRMATADTEPVTVASRAGWFRAHDPASRPLWVVEAADGLAGSDGLAGWLSFQSFYGRPAYHATAELSVYVAPVHQRRGVARRLVGHALRRSPALGLRTLVGFVFGHNTASLALFAGFGFARWGLLPRVAELDRVERDLVIVGRRVETT
jgi:L-amino acid N-acyltransferase YncA